MNDYYGEEGPNTPRNLAAGLHPSLKAAGIMWIVLIAVAAINALTGGTSILFCYPVRLLLYVATGALAAYFAVNSAYVSASLIRIGAIAGFAAWILPAIFYFIVALILGFATLGVGFLGLAAWLLCGPIDLALHVALSALGASVYGHFSGAGEGGEANTDQ